MRSLLIGLLCLSAPLPCAAQVTVSLAPVRDNTLFQESTGALSNGQGLRLYAGRNASTGGATRRRAVLAFDLGQLPSCATITSAFLQLTVAKAPSFASPTTMELHALTADWGEGASNAGSGGLPTSGGGGGAASAPGDATWLHTFFPGQQWARAGGDFVAAVSAAASVGTTGSTRWGGPGLVADLQRWVDVPGSNFGWILIGDERAPQTARAFRSREEVSARPLLQITYLEPSASVTASGTGCAGSGAVPLALAANGLPALGNAGFAFQLSGGPPSFLQGVVFSAFLAPTPIPFGAPGCTIQVDLATFALVLTATAGSVPLPIPANPSLLCTTLAAQGLAGDTATGLLTFSNALMVQLGR